MIAANFHRGLTQIRKRDFPTWLLRIVPLVCGQLRRVITWRALEDLHGGIKVLAMRVQHLEIPDDRYTVYVTPTRSGHAYNCQVPCCFQEPAAPLVIDMVQAAIDGLIAGKMRWAR